MPRPFCTLSSRALGTAAALTVASIMITFPRPSYATTDIFAQSALAAPATSPQTVPTPTPTPAEPPGGPARGRGGAAPTTGASRNGAVTGHFPIIDLVPIFTQPQFATSGPLKMNGQPSVDAYKNNGTGFDPLDIAGTILLPITPGVSASFDRVVGGTLSVPQARATSARQTNGAEPYLYNAFTRDAVLTYHFDEQLKRLTFEEGLYFRHRIVGGSNTSNNPLLPTISSTESHVGYAGITYTSAAFAWLVNGYISLNINVDTQSVDHHVACLPATYVGVSPTCPKGNLSGVIDENPHVNRYWQTDQYVQLTLPIDRRRGLSFVAQDRWGAINLYENAPFPYRFTTSQTYLLTKRFSRAFALSLRDRSQWVAPLGYPFVKPNAQHNGSIDVLADIKVRTGSLR